MTPARVVSALLSSVLLTAGIGFASRAAYAPKFEHAALLRLSWRMHMKQLHTCRTRTAEELAALPAHMRSPEVCTARHVEYRLTIRVDDGVPDTMLVVPTGAKGDRPLFVLHDVPLEPGEHQVHVEFAPTSAVANAAVLSYAGTLVAPAGRIRLITLSADGAALVLVGEPH